MAGAACLHGLNACSGIGPVADSGVDPAWSHLMKRRTVLALLSGLLLSLSVAGYTALHSRPAGSHADIVYKVVGDQKIPLDIYLPEKANGKTPVVVFIHGGSWIRGDKSILGRHYFKTHRDRFLEEGFAVVSINYRLSSPGGPHFPEPIVDCKDAVRWVRKNADLYNFDAEKIGLWGVSAGGHLAMMVAYSDEQDYKGAPELAAYSSEVNYVINHYGPTHLPTLFEVETGKEPIGYARHIVYSILGPKATAPLDERAQIFTQYSPVTNVRKKVPTLTFHGSADPVVPVNQAHILDSALKKVGVQSDLVIYEGEGHGFITMGQEGRSDLLRRGIEFAKQYSKNHTATALSR